MSYLLQSFGVRIRFRVTWLRNQGKVQNLENAVQAFICVPILFPLDGSYNSSMPNFSISSHVTEKLRQRSKFRSHHLWTNVFETLYNIFDFSISGHATQKIKSNVTILNSFTAFICGPMFSNLVHFFLPIAT